MIAPTKTIVQNNSRLPLWKSLRPMLRLIQQRSPNPNKPSPPGPILGPTCFQSGSWRGNLGPGPGIWVQFGPRPGQHTFTFTRMMSHHPQHTHTKPQYPSGCKLSSWRGMCGVRNSGFLFGRLNDPAQKFKQDLNARWADYLQSLRPPHSDRVL